MLPNIVYFPVYLNLRAIGLLVRNCLVLPSVNYVLLFSIIIIIIIIIIISLLYSAFPLFSFECFASLCRYYLNVVYWLNGRERLFPILHSLLILFLERSKT